MTFEGQYLTYEEYRALGGSLSQMPFNLLEYEARKQIDIKTQNRLVNKEEIPQGVKLCIYNLIGKINSYAETIEASSGNIANESTDGYSISYVTADRVSEIVRSKNNEIQDIIMNYLYGIIVDGEHIIYNGVR